MSKFRQNKSKEVPEVSTASLPDIVFIVLAFFVTVSS
ncbi:MAG: biopolymer transport protein ExbD, partial [Flavobacteriales bacterium]